MVHNFVQQLLEVLADSVLTFFFALVKTRPEAVSEDVIETETESMDQTDSATGAQSEIKTKVNELHDSLETEPDSFAENKMETASCAESERLLS